jgi:hypothetical protein
MLTSTLDSSVPLLTEQTAPYDNLYAMAKAACSTYETLVANGLSTTPTEADRIEAENVLCAVADPSIKVPNALKTLQKPASVAHLTEILSSFDQRVVDSAVQLRTYVTNRLIIESRDEDARIRIKALELLGRISDVGLFTERSELTVHHRATTDIEAKLREKLERLIGSSNSHVVLKDDIIDVDVELGLTQKNAN